MRMEPAVPTEPGDPQGDSGFPEEDLVIKPTPAPEPLVDIWGHELSREGNPALDPPAGWMPDASELASVGGPDSREEGSRNKQCQVNVRLDPADYRALTAAAQLYGTRPTTFARMLINRGAQATLAAHRAEFMLDPRD
jgi:hypothetical protein